VNSFLGTTALTAGVVVTFAAGYLVVRGPFLGGPLLEPPGLFAALAGFVVGVVAITWGAARLVGVGARV
jgi:hypothetical protein